MFLIQCYDSTAFWATLMYLQQSCYIPKHLGNHSSKLTKLKMQFFYGSVLTRIKAKLLCIPRVALLVSKPAKWLQLFFVPKHLFMLIIMCQTNTEHPAVTFTMNPMHRTNFHSNVEVSMLLTLCTISKFLRTLLCNFRR